jgi:DNA-directed RNA polymerase I and III subunit RPAC1
MIPSRIKEKKERQVLGFEKPEMVLFFFSFTFLSLSVFNAKLSTLDSFSTFGSTGVDNEWNLDLFKQEFRIHPISNTPNRLIFQMDGIDASIANAYRRIMLSEVPTMCIETVFVHKNTSVIPDEVFFSFFHHHCFFTKILSHRLGLIPLLIDPAKFKFKES